MSELLNDRDSEIARLRAFAKVTQDEIKELEEKFVFIEGALKGNGFRFCKISCWRETVYVILNGGVTLKKFFVVFFYQNFVTLKLS